MTDKRLQPRILLVEDDPARIEVFRSWLIGTGFVLIEASSAGRARGVLRKGMTEGIKGLLLDNDLEKQPVTSQDLLLSGSDLVAAIAQTLDRTVPILIHSMNATRPLGMQRALASVGFSVSRVPFAILTRGRFLEWLDEVNDNLDEGE
ncbi:hypothetical protein [Propionivibrio dicarboxylicus]|uniref:Response regulatory domain-containing protein n=1 Tax=Propionivibrio dicarboxylicus TaxID=83767 RepID=A0A1G8NKC2_9RHOO|nr:hypothetical protein [Propionivibrio dicarboxylicus]SDI80476.1 hypothetical protein SAMN05660652_04062 [Propionivibrio dicarboxylicus]